MKLLSCVSLKTANDIPALYMTAAGIPQKHNVLLQHLRTEAIKETSATLSIKNKAFCLSATSVNMA